MLALLKLLALFLVIAAIPFLITYAVVRVTKVENSRKGASESTKSGAADFPVAIRLLFLVLGIVSLYFGANVAYALFANGASTEEIYPLIILTLCSMCAFSVGLPKRYRSTNILALNLGCTTLILAGPLWHTGELGRWGFLALAVVLPMLITIAIANRR